MTLKFTVRCDPVAWQRTRVSIRRNSLTFINTDSLREYEHLIATHAALAARSQGWVLVDDKPVTLALHFRLRIPPSWTKRRKAQMFGQPHASKPDASNLAKAAEDGIIRAGSLLRDDSQIARLTVTKVWSDNPGVDVEIRHD